MYQIVLNFGHYFMYGVLVAFLILYYKFMNLVKEVCKSKLCVYVNH